MRRPRHTWLYAATAAALVWTLLLVAGVPLPSLFLTAILFGRRAPSSTYAFHDFDPARFEPSSNSNATDTAAGVNPCDYDAMRYTTAAAAMDAYAAFHRCARNGLRTRYLVHEAVDGLGNRLVGIASSYLYAMLTGRVFLVAWPTEPGQLHAPLQDLLQEPDFDWAGDTMMVTAVLYRGLAAVSRRQEWEFDGRLACRDLRHDWRPVVWMRSNQYFAPLILDNPVWAAWVRRSGFADGYFAQVAHRLFRPQPALRARVDAWFADRGIAPANAVGVHLRAFRTGTALATAPLYTGAATSAVRMVSSDTGAQVTAVVGSDAPQAAQLVVDTLPAGAAHLLTHTRAVTNMVTRQTHADAEDSVVELFILGSCARVVATSGSTYGMVAQGLSGRTGITVTASTAVMRDSTEPCFTFYHPEEALPCGGALSSQVGRCEACCYPP